MRKDNKTKKVRIIKCGRGKLLKESTTKYHAYRIDKNMDSGTFCKNPMSENSGRIDGE
jgi:hypothetical protein